MCAQIGRLYMNTAPSEHLPFGWLAADVCEEKARSRGGSPYPSVLAGARWRSGDDSALTVETAASNVLRR